MTSRLSPTTTQAIQDRLDHFLRTWNEKDLDGFMDNFTDDAEFTDVVSQTAIGKEAIRKQHEFAFNVVMKNASFEMSNILAREIVPDVVMVSAHWLNKNSQTPNGKTLPDRNGVIQFVLIKDLATDWRAKSSITLIFPCPMKNGSGYFGESDSIYPV